MSEPGVGHPQPLRLGALDIDLAPDEPGIYAWYARLALSESDWKPRIRGNVDLAARDLIRAVTDYARIHQGGPVSLKGDGTYGVNWSGLLRRDQVSEPEADSGISRMESQLGELASAPDSRRLFTELLLETSPIFASPLYIGVATNLRARLAEHKAAYEQAKAALRNDPSSCTQLQYNGESFGARIAGAGIQLEHLDCWVLPIAAIATLSTKPQSKGQPDRRSVAQAAEWVLQRIFLPVLGRK